MNSTYRILSVVLHTSCSELVYILVTLLIRTYWHNLCHVSIARRTAGNQLVSSHFCWNLLSHGQHCTTDCANASSTDRTISISLSPPFPLNLCNKGTQCPYTIFFSNYQQSNRYNCRASSTTCRHAKKNRPPPSPLVPHRGFYSRYRARVYFVPLRPPRGLPWRRSSLAVEERVFERVRF